MGTMVGREDSKRKEVVRSYVRVMTPTVVEQPSSSDENAKPTQSPCAVVAAADHACGMRRMRGR